MYSDTDTNTDNSENDVVIMDESYSGTTEESDSDSDGDYEEYHQYGQTNALLSNNINYVLEYNGLDIYDQMYAEDINHNEQNKQSGEYYIGLCIFNDCIIDNTSYILFGNSISTNLFYRYSGHRLAKYMYLYGGSYFMRKNIHVMQLQIVDGMYTAILKTFWIKIIQRHWRKVFEKIETVRMARYSLESQISFELTGKYKRYGNIMPSLRGMLAAYK